MDKRNESINKQIVQFIDKVTEFGIPYERTPYIDVTDQQALFKILSDDNKTLKNISTKIIKISELNNNLVKLKSEVINDIPEIPINFSKSIDTLDATIETLTLLVNKITGIIKQQNIKEEELDVVEEPKVKANGISSERSSDEFRRDSSDRHLPNPGVIVNMEEIKRAFFNNEFEQFTQLIKQHPFAYYRATYKYSSDNNGKPEYIAKNLVGGFVRNMEDYSKYFLTCFRCYKNENSYEYPSLWIVNIGPSDDQVFSIEDVIGSLYDDYDFVPVTETMMDDFLKDLGKKANDGDDNLLIEKYVH